MKKEKQNSSEAVIAELEQKVERLKSALESYKNEIRNSAAYKTERQIFRDLATVFASSENFDNLFQRTMEIVSQHLKARYYGIFWLNDEKSHLEFRYGKNYKSSVMSAIPQAGSLMGECLFKRDIVWIPDVRLKSACIPLNQEPPEYNVLCAPIILFGEDSGVVRLANIDTEYQDIAAKVLKTISPLLCSSLERLLLLQRNRQALKGLDAGFSVARLLENTLSDVEILKKVCSQIPKLFTCRASIIALKSEAGIKSVFSWPENFFLGGNPDSNTIYLRNLIEAYPDGNACIENIHRDKRWAWPQRDVRSLCMAGLHFQGVLHGLAIAVGPGAEVYGATEKSLLGIVAAQTSITLERASYFRKQEELAASDGLTGLLNHRMFQESIRFELERANRYNHPLSLVMCDIDHFKRFNDTYGHQVGDEVLKMVSRTLKVLKRTTDRAFRYGGEEFCVILPETTSQNAVNLAERLRLKIEENRAVRGLSVTISLGIAEHRKGESAEELIKRADSLLYKSKEGGRNRVTVG